MALVPESLHSSGGRCNYASWLTRGWCRAEWWCHLLSNKLDTSYSGIGFGACGSRDVVGCQVYGDPVYVYILYIWYRSDVCVYDPAS